MRRHPAVLGLSALAPCLNGHVAALRRTIALVVTMPQAHDQSMDTTWSIADLMNELENFEREARAAGLKENSVRTYVDRSRYFVRWLAGDFQFQGPHQD